MVRHTGEDFINVKGIAISSVLSFQATGIYGSKLDTPETDCLAATGDAALGQ